MARFRLDDENNELAEMREQIKTRLAYRRLAEYVERGFVRVDIRIPDSCKECAFRLNDSREHWKCFWVRTIRNTPYYISKTVADDERADFCPFNKKG